jgi:hypothetical protein
MQEMSSAGNPSLPEVRRRCFPDRSYDRLNSRCVEFSCILVDHFPTIPLGIERLSASAPKPPQRLAASSRAQGRTMVGLAFSRRHVSLIRCPSQAAYAKRSAVANTSGRSEGNEAATQPTRVRVSRTYLSAAAGKSSLSSQRVSGSRRAEATPTSDDTQVGSLFRRGHCCVTELSPVLHIQADSVSTSLEARRLFLKTASRLLDSDDAELREAAKNAMLRYLSDYST